MSQHEEDNRINHGDAGAGFLGMQPDTSAAGGGHLRDGERKGSEAACAGAFEHPHRVWQLGAVHRPRDQDGQSHHRLQQHASGELYLRHARAWRPLRQGGHQAADEGGHSVHHQPAMCRHAGLWARDEEWRQGRPRLWHQGGCCSCLQHIGRTHPVPSQRT